MKYDFLLKLTAPKLLVQAVKLIGTEEIVGKENNPVIMNWAKVIGQEKAYTSDEIAWCGLFVAFCCYSVGLAPVKNPLWARNWLNYGVPQKVAMLGDVLVFSRPNGGGHVGIYVGEDATCYHVLGGNQSNKVNVTRVLKSRILGIRRTDWKISQPKEVRVVLLDANGIVSTNEA